MAPAPLLADGGDGGTSAVAESVDGDGGHNSSPWVAAFNLCNAAVGAGVLAFPFAFRQSGLLGGLLVAATIWLVEVAALAVLVRAAERTRCQSYQDLVNAELGRSASVATSLMMLVYLVGSMIAYLIIVGDVFQPMASSVFGSASLLANRRIVISALAAGLVLPMALQQTLRALKWTSMLAVVMLLYLTTALVCIGINKILTFFRGGSHIFMTADIVVFAFQCHIQVVPIFVELASRPKQWLNSAEDVAVEDLTVPLNSTASCHSRRLKTMDGVIGFSMLLCFVAYSLVGAFGYIIYPEVKSDVLQSFGTSSIFMNVARAGMAVVAMVCYPVNSLPARSILTDFSEYTRLVGPVDPVLLQQVLTLVLFASTLATALLVRDLGQVYAIVGSSGGVMVIFIIPGLLLLKGAHSTSGRASFTDRVAGVIVVFFGTLIFLATIHGATAAHNARQ
eukprot:SM000013S26557  [mRNA]  locus=s13:1027816:1030640:- [translate_table: standard]